MNPFEVLAEPARRRIIDILASGEHTAGELAAAVGGEFKISRSAVCAPRTTRPGRRGTQLSAPVASEPDQGW